MKNNKHTFLPQLTCLLLFPLLVNCGEKIIPLEEQKLAVKAILDANELQDVEIDGEMVGIKENKITALALDDQGISIIPEGTFNKLKYLTFLSLDKNNIENLSSDIGQLTDLEELYLKNNKLKSILPEICNLIKLKTLIVSYNEIEDLPENIGNLENLEKVEIHNNKLKTVPGSIYKWKNITELDLGSNQLEVLPDGLGNMQQLKIISIRSNQLSTFPLCLYTLTQLEVIDLYDNKISKISSDILNNQSLYNLIIGKNSFNTFPDQLLNKKSLKMLGFSENQITALPNDIDKLSNLRFIRLENNNLSSIPESIYKLPINSISKNNERGMYIEGNKICSISKKMELWLNDHCGDWRNSQRCK